MAAAGVWPTLARNLCAGCAGSIATRFASASTDRSCVRLISVACSDQLGEGGAAAACKASAELNCLPARPTQEQFTSVFATIMARARP